MAVREFKLPDVGEGLSEAEIVNWLVEVGDEVSEDQPVAEAETDKAVVEVPSPVNGTVKEILADAGEMVPVGNVIITFEVAEGDGNVESAAEAEPADAEESTAAEQTAEADEAAGGETTDASADDGAEQSVPEGRVFASPSARRLARELGVDIAQVEGSGPGGRVSDADVRAHAESTGDESADESAPEPEPAPTEGGGESVTERVGGGDGASAAVQQVEAADRERTLATPATRRVAEEEGVDLDAVPTEEERDGVPYVTTDQVVEYAEAQQAAQEADAQAVQQAVEGVERGAAEPGEREERVPYRGIRRTIGQQMEQSKFTAPHVTHHDDVVVEGLVEARQKLRAEAEERGVKLTYMPFVMKAIVAGLKEYPVLNSQLDEENEEIVKKHYYNIGVAVATDAGLMVPVVRDVDRKGLLQIQREMNELVEKARNRKISREEMQGGTFSITNFGAIGGKHATPIINYPETAIMGLGAIQEEPVVEDGEVVPAHVMGVSLSIDHRVIDGAEAAAFTETVKRYLENPSLLLLE